MQRYKDDNSTKHVLIIVIRQKSLLYYMFMQTRAERKVDKLLHIHKCTKDVQTRGIHIWLFIK